MVGRWLRIVGRSGSLTKISIHVYQNSVESFVKQREVVFEVRMYTFIEFSIRLSLGLNSYVHRSAVSAPKSEDEHSFFQVQYNVEQKKLGFCSFCNF